MTRPRHCLLKGLSAEVAITIPHQPRGVPQLLASKVLRDSYRANYVAAQGNFEDGHLVRDLEVVSGRNQTICNISHTRSVQRHLV